MDKVFNYVKANRDDIMTLGFILIVVGLFIGISLSGYGSNSQEVIGNILLMGILPIGVFILLYGYHIKFYKNPTILLKRCVLFIILMILSLCIESMIIGIYSQYPIGILSFIIFMFGLEFMKKEKLK
jgi:phosphoglycerol transferase MdoB-like AlkP superfamily enzyme